jgi:hypothetical protein
LLGFVSVVALNAIAWRSRPVPWRRLLVPIVCSLSAGAALTTFYDWKVTGHPLQLPDLLAQQQYGVPQTLVFQAPFPPPSSKPYGDVMDVYWWQRHEHDRFWRSTDSWGIQYDKLTAFWHFYLHPLCAVPLLALPWVLRSRKMRLLLGAGLFVTLGTALYSFYFAHYTAPVAGILIILLVEGVRYLAAWTRHWKGGGLLIPGTVLAVAGIGASLLVLAIALHGSNLGRRFIALPAQAVMRQRIEERFAAAGGKHLVIVRYGPDHSYHNPVVYNRARIDESPVVWARELGPQRDPELLRYYSDRSVWLFEPDKKPPAIVPYSRASGAR